MRPKPNGEDQLCFRRTGSGTHMNAEKFRISAGIDAQHVPYKGTPEALTDTMARRVDYFFAR